MIIVNVQVKNQLIKNLQAQAFEVMFDYINDSHCDNKETPYLEAIKWLQNEDGITLEQEKTILSLLTPDFQLVDTESTNQQQVNP